jgi:hypothetical protein
MGLNVGGGLTGTPVDNALLDQRKATARAWFEAIAGPDLCGI